MSLGLQALVPHVLASNEGSDFHLSGFQKFTPACAKYAVVASLAGYLPDAVLLELLEDDRVASRPDHYVETMDTELEWLAALPSFVFAQLSTLLEDEVAESLRSDCLEAGHTAAGYMADKFLATANEYPWRLVQGSIPSNLEVLRYLAEPEAQQLDDTTYKVWSLLQQGYGVESLTAGLELLSQIRWSTTVVEQGHASASLTKHSHAAYGISMIASRAHLHMLRPLSQVPVVPRHFEPCNKNYSD